jgi:predicted transglutaminase-like cysteine proteinase
MSNSQHARRAAPLFTIVLGAGLLACLGAAKAGETGVPASETFEFKMASAAPFEELRDTPKSRLTEPFGLESSALVIGGLQDKWGGVAKQLPHEHEILTRCRADINGCPPAAKLFLGIVDKAMTRSGLARIGEINRTINLAVKWIDDIDQYGVPDLWATPLMTFSSQAGNCKHYAIAKYAALQEIGISTDDLRLLVVRDRPTNQLHAVAAVRYDGRWLILDNRTFMMVQDLDIATYNPVYVIDKEGVKRPTPWAPKSQISQASASPTSVDPQFSSVWQSMPLLM